MGTIKNPIAWTEIYTEDLGRARKFYETVLNVKLEAMPMPEGMEADPGNDEYFEMLFFPGEMDAPGGGALVNSPMFKPGPGGTIVYFSCEDCAVELSRVEEAGGKVITEKMSLGEHGFCGLASDTEGNTIGFHSDK